MLSSAGLPRSSKFHCSGKGTGAKDGLHTHMLFDEVMCTGTLTRMASLEGGGAIPSPGFITFPQTNL